MKRTSPGSKTCSAPAALRQLPPAHRLLPSARRRRKAVSAAPSSRFMPIQSQPTASGCISCSLHSWSSQARPRTGTALAGAPQRALHRQLRLAQVVAGLGFVRPLAREAGIALQQQRLGGAQLQLQLEVLRPLPAGEEPNCVRYRLAPSASLPLQRPAAEQQIGVA